jgi:hypothetical protein
VEHLALSVSTAGAGEAGQGPCLCNALPTSGGFAYVEMRDLGSYSGCWRRTPTERLLTFLKLKKYLSDDSFSGTHRLVLLRMLQRDRSWCLLPAGP